VSTPASGPSGKVLSAVAGLESRLQDGEAAMGAIVAAVDRLLRLLLLLPASGQPRDDSEKLARLEEGRHPGRRRLSSGSMNDKAEGGTEKADFGV